MMRHQMMPSAGHFSPDEEGLASEVPTGPKLKT